MVLLWCYCGAMPVSVNVRFPSELHARLKAEALADGRSLNALIVRRLSVGVLEERDSVSVASAASRGGSRSSKARTTLCEHRVPAGSFCSRGCD